MVNRNAHKIQRKGWDEEKQEKRKEEVEENDNDNDEESCLAYNNNGFHIWKVAFFCFGQAIMKRLQAWKRDHVLEFSRIVLVVEEKTKFWLYSQET